MTKKTGGQIVCEGLLKQGVDTVFGIPGGAILPLYGSLSQYPDLKHILVRHEQGASHAADGLQEPLYQLRNIVILLWILEI